MALKLISFAIWWVFITVFVPNYLYLFVLMHHKGVWIRIHGNELIGSAKKIYIYIFKKLLSSGNGLLFSRRMSVRYYTEKEISKQTRSYTHKLIRVRSKLNSEGMYHEMWMDHYFLSLCLSVWFFLLLFCLIKVFE